VTTIKNVSKKQGVKKSAAKTTAKLVLKMPASKTALGASNVVKIPASKPRNPVIAALKAASTGKRAGKHVKTEAALRREANVALQTLLKKGS
jgi:hypothetical protein